MASKCNSKSQRPQGVRDVCCLLHADCVCMHSDAPARPGTQTRASRKQPLHHISDSFIIHWGHECRIFANTNMFCIFFYIIGQEQSALKKKRQTDKPQEHPATQSPQKPATQSPQNPATQSPQKPAAKVQVCLKMQKLVGENVTQFEMVILACKEKRRMESSQNSC